MLNGARVREARLKIGKAQQTIDLAIKAPIGTCCKLEAGVCTITPAQFGLLCDVLKADRTWLLTDGEAVKAETNESLATRVSKMLKEKLREYESKAHKTHKQVADELGITWSALYKYSNGYGTPSKQLADKILSLYGFNIEDALLPGESLNYYTKANRTVKKTKEYVLERDDGIRKKLIKMQVEMLKLKHRLGEATVDDCMVVIDELEKLV